MISRRAMVAAGALAVAATQSRTTNAAVPTDLAPAGARTLKALADVLLKTPRRRDFKSVRDSNQSRPMGSCGLVESHRLYSRSQAAVGSHGSRRPMAQSHAQLAQCANLVIQEPGFSLRVGDPRFGASSALRSSGLGQISACQFRRRQIQDQYADRAAEAGSADPRTSKIEGVFSSADNAIPTLMRRGVVFLACHNAIAELADKLIKREHQSRSNCHSSS